MSYRIAAYGILCFLLSTKPFIYKMAMLQLFPISAAGRTGCGHQIDRSSIAGLMDLRTWIQRVIAGLDGCGVIALLDRRVLAMEDGKSCHKENGNASTIALSIAHANHIVYIHTCKCWEVSDCGDSGIACLQYIGHNAIQAFWGEVPITSQHSPM